MAQEYLNEHLESTLHKIASHCPSAQLRAAIQDGNGDAGSNACCRMSDFILEPDEDGGGHFFRCRNAQGLCCTGYVNAAQPYAPEEAAALVEDENLV